MPEPINTAYMNMPAEQIERVHDPKALRESPDQHTPFERLQRREEEEEKESQPQDSYDHESENDDVEDAKQVKVEKHQTTNDAESPGFMIDIVV